MNSIKIHLLLFLSSIMISNLYSQTEQFNYLLVKNNKITSPDVIEKNNHIFFDREIFGNQHPNTIRKQSFDNITIVDSVIIITSTGGKYRITFGFDSNWNWTSKLLERWDGSQWANRRLTTNVFDSNGNMTFYYYEIWDGSKWVNNYQQETYTYNSDGNMTSHLIEIWDSNQWVNSWRHAYTYNSNENMTSHLIEKWDSSNWVNSWRETYVFDSNGNMASYFSEKWDGSNWVNSWRFSYTYNSNGNRIFYLSETGDSTQWVNRSQMTYTYNSSGNMVSYLIKTWNSSQWVLYKRATYTYDSNGKMTSDFPETWDGSKWVNSNSGSTYTYDSSGNMISATYETVDRSHGGQDIFIWRYTYTYDSNGNRTSHFSETLYNNTWQSDWLYTYTYDANGYMIFSLFESWYGDKYGTFQFFDSFGNSYEYSGSEINIYYSTITDVEEKDFIILDFALSQNYPNPFNPSTTIEYSIPNDGFVKLKVYDVLGKEVASLVDKEQAMGNYKIEFNASSLTSGVYFYRLQSGSFIKTKKLILLR